MFFMVPSFKEEFKSLDFKGSKQVYSPKYSLNLPPRSHINPSHFRKTNWLPVSDRVEYCIPNTVFKYWNGIVPAYIHEIFKPSLC